jgi:Ca-activated chloride channel family protein
MRLTILSVVVMLAVDGLAAQGPTKLEVTSPLDGAYVSGPVRIEARLVPLAAEREIIRVSMSADGREVCTLDRRPYSCAWNAGAAIRKHQIRVVVELVGGQKFVKNVITRGVDVGESTGVSAVKVTTTVKDREGRFVSGLKPRDFTVYEDRARQTITGFAAEQAEVTVGLALDTSGSMARALEGVKRQAKLFLGLLPSNWPTPVLAFDNSVFVIAPPGMSHDDRDRNIGLLKPWGGTALYNAVLRALAEVEGGEGRKAVIVFTDGDDRNSTVDPTEVRRAIESSDAVVYFVASGEAARNVTMMKFVAELAEISGGRVLRGTNEEELAQAFAEVREEIRNQYLLTYVPPRLEKPGTWRPLSVEVACAGCRVRARTGYIVVAK